MNEALVAKVAEAMKASDAPVSSYSDLARAALTALGADEVSHKVHLFPSHFVVEHPIVERLEGSLAACLAHSKVQEYLDEYGSGGDGVYWVSNYSAQDIELVKVEG